MVCAYIITSLGLAFGLQDTNSSQFVPPLVRSQRAEKLLQERKFDEAAKELAEGLKDAERWFGKDSFFACSWHHNIAFANAAAGRYSLAEDEFKRVLGIFEKQPERKLEVAQCLDNLANLHHKLGMFELSQSEFERSLLILRQLPGGNKLPLALVLNNAGDLFHTIGQYGKAEDYYQESLRLVKKDSIEAATAHNNLAILYKATSRYGKADSEYALGYEILKLRLKENDPRMADSLANLAVYDLEMGRRDVALERLKRSLGILEGLPGSDPLSLIPKYNGLGVAFMSAKRYSESEQAFNKARTLVGKLNNPSPLELATLESNCGELFARMNQFEKAENCVSNSLAIQESLFKNHPLIATTLARLGRLQLKAGRIDQAWESIEKSLIMRRSTLGDHPDVAESLHLKAAWFTCNKNPEKAASAYHEAIQIDWKHVIENLPFLSESEQLLFLRDDFHKRQFNALEFALANKNIPKILEQSASWILNNKAVTIPALSQPILAGRASKRKEISDLFAELAANHKALEAERHSPAAPEYEEVCKQRLSSFLSRQSELRKKLRQEMSLVVNTQPWLDVEKLQSELPADTVLIEIVRMSQDQSVSDINAAKDSQHYFAWIIPPYGKGSIAVVDLGLSRDIDEHVNSVLKEMKPPEWENQQGEAPSWRRTLRDAGEKILDPLLPYVSIFPNWVISPDDHLCTLPWGALLLKDGVHAMEKHCMSFVVTGRDLMRPQVRIETTAPVVFAFDSSDVLDSPILEATEMASGIQSWLNESPRLFQGQHATASALKSLQRPRAIVTISHAFYQEPPRPDGIVITRAKEMEEHRKYSLDNPLIRCGLELAPGLLNDKKDRDLKTRNMMGIEVLDCDFRGTELVVLAGCETGLGEVRNYEGMMCLSQAFQLAGCQDVVGSLWKPADRTTVELMSAFFHYLGAGFSTPEALNKAQKDILRGPGASGHPYFWACWTLTESATLTRQTKRINVNSAEHEVGKRNTNAVKIALWTFILAVMVILICWRYRARITKRIPKR